MSDFHCDWNGFPQTHSGRGPYGRGLGVLGATRPAQASLGRSRGVSGAVFASGGSREDASGVPWLREASEACPCLAATWRLVPMQVWTRSVREGACILHFEGVLRGPARC